MSFKAYVFLMIFYLDNLSINVRGVINSLILFYCCIILSVNIFFIYLGAPRCMCKYFKMLYFVGLTSLSLCNTFFIISYDNLCIKVPLVYIQLLQLSLVFHLKEISFFQPFTLSFCVLTSEVNHSQSKYRWVFFSNSFSYLCLFIATFSPFLFKASTDRYVFIAILFIVLCLFLQFISVSSLILLPCGLMTFFSAVFIFLSLHLLCIC